MGWPFDAFQSGCPDVPLLSPIDIPLAPAEVKLRPLVFDGHFNSTALTRIANTGETGQISLRDAKHLQIKNRTRTREYNPTPNKKTCHYVTKGNVVLLLKCILESFWKKAVSHKREPYS